MSKIIGNGLRPDEGKGISRNPGGGGVKIGPARHIKPIVYV